VIDHFPDAFKRLRTPDRLEYAGLFVVHLTRKRLLRKALLIKYLFHKLHPAHPFKEVDVALGDFEPGYFHKRRLPRLKVGRHRVNEHTVKVEYRCFHAFIWKRWL